MLRLVRSPAARAGPAPPRLLTLTEAPDGVGRGVVWVGAGGVGGGGGERRRKEGRRRHDAGGGGGVGPGAGGGGGGGGESGARHDHHFVAGSLQSAERAVTPLNPVRVSLCR